LTIHNLFVGLRPEAPKAGDHCQLVASTRVERSRHGSLDGTGITCRFSRGLIERPEWVEPAAMLPSSRWETTATIPVGDRPVAIGIFIQP
jgi:hypothetical protein